MDTCNLEENGWSFRDIGIQGISGFLGYSEKTMYMYFQGYIPKYFWDLECSGHTYPVYTFDNTQ